MRSYPRLKLLLINCAVLVVLLVVAEYSLRSLGFPYTRKPDPLVLGDTFTVNKHGLFTANPESATFRQKGITINREGFRSPEFPPQSSPRPDKTTVMIIGDSFTWGASADPVSHSFADRLRAEGYVVYNLGIPATGPTQYRKLAEVYLPVLKPDVVIVALYLGNDICAKEFEAPPGRLPYYVTKDDGWISPFDSSGRYIEDLGAAYENWQNGLGKFRRFLRETVIGTQIIFSVRVMKSRIFKSRAIAASQAATGTTDPSQVQLLEKYPHTYHELKRIMEAAQAQGARYYTLVIPALGKGCLPSSDFALETQKAVLGEFHPVYMELSDDHYNPSPDGHFNNEGHAVAARTLIRLLRGKSPEP